jgi:isoleucyl-tRNA synthetase
VTSLPDTTRFATLPADQAADDLERELLARWEAEDLFARTLAASEGKPSFVFFEGPPTANGRPGIHHVFSRTIKDLFCRHRAMKGFRVERKAGWDTHGLPVEIEIEKKLGISGKQQIEALGVAEFNRLSRESVFTYRADWEKLSSRIGYWLDYAHPYVTYHNEYVESVWWALKTLHDKGYLYRGHKILPYCPRCGTALSSHEVAQGYEDVDDPSVYVALDLVDDAPAPPGGGRRILVWTTTPWTLVSNTALAVHPELAYIELVRKEGKDARSVILAESRVRAVLGDDFATRWELVRLLRGAELAGLRYRRPIDWLPYPPGEHEIIVGEDFVSADDGTGVVHMSPAFGADDYAAGQRHGLAFLQPVNAQGEFPPDLPLVGGKFVKAADPLLIDELKRRGVLWKAGKITHAYPHCWRCGTPLLYYARTSWFVKTTAYRDRMLARNARVDWHPPEVGEGRFGEWLKNNIDWAISRDRYWGTPLPVWVCDADEAHVDVVGGFGQLAERAGAALPEDFDPHKPHVDGYAWPCGRCAGTMRRVPEVIDTWFDSGLMSFAQWGYPHQPGSREALAAQYPADFIAEGVDQTRGWFYSLLAIATGLDDALPNNAGASTREPGATPAPYGHVVVNDMVLDADGLKMSKSRGNIVDPWQVIASHGADAVRLFLVASADVSVPRKFDERAIREQAVRFLLTLRNVYSGMFAQYANYGWEPSAADPAPADRSPMDRWMLSRLGELEQLVDGALERYDATAAARLLVRFVDDDVANWYVRLSRSRFYEVGADDNRAAFATLHEVLVTTCRLLAPLAPFLSDWIHRELTGGSVHLAPYVRADAAPRDPDLERAMAAVRMLAKLGRAAREEAGVKVRQPLSRMVCVAPEVTEEALVPLVGLLANELNVKRVDFARTGDALVTLEARPNFRSLGKKFGKHTPLAARAIQAFTNDDLRGFLGGAPLAVTAGGEAHQLEVDDVTIVRRASGDLVVEEESGFFAALDPAVTPELRLEGLARELVSRIQRLRKDSGLAVSDRIVLYVGGQADVEASVRAHGEWIGSEVLATRVVWRDGGVTDDQATMPAVEIDDTTARIAITKAE